MFLSTRTAAGKRFTERAKIDSRPGGNEGRKRSPQETPAGLSLHLEKKDGATTQNGWYDILIQRNRNISGKKQPDYIKPTALHRNNNRNTTEGGQPCQL